MIANDVEYPNQLSPTAKAFDKVRTSLTTSFRQGVPAKVVSERLGHTSPAFTMSVYQHVLPGMQAEADSVGARLVDR
jgi:integrase